MVITCIEDLREIARHKVPRMFFDYAESGSYAEETLHANRRDLEAILLRQKILVDVSKRSTATQILGKPVSVPLALAPIGLCGMQRGNGEILAAKAAAKAGIPFCLSTMSVCSIEDVAEEVSEPFWFQLYVMRDRKFIRALVERAKVAKCSALVLTVDLQVLGQRHRDIKNGLSVPPKMRIANLIDIATKPGWIISVLRAKRRNFGNIVGHVEGVGDNTSLAEWTNSQFDPALNWEDVKWIRSIWKGPLILKGILDTDDAKLAADHGADAVGQKVEVLFDGGVRSGQDVMRALALGAKACMIGRAYIYGLGARGEEGVGEAIGFIRRELETTMALTGVNKISEIGPQVIAR